MNGLPEIRIKDAWLLRESVSIYLNELWGDGEPLRSDEDYREITENYRKAWHPFEEKVLNGMQDLLGLGFRQKIIDVYIAPWFAAFSDPMVIGVIYEPDRFVDVLTHELIHRLLTDNTKIPYNLFLLPEWEKLFGKNHDQDTLIHIPVHAVHKAIYLDVLQDKRRLNRDIAADKELDATAYVASRLYVDSHNHKEIIERLKASYNRLAEEVKND